jgi:hypothetical protein
MWPRLIVAAVCGIVGVVWIAQGVGVLHGSPMTGQAFWAVAGAALEVITAWLLVGAARRRAARARTP